MSEESQNDDSLLKNQLEGEKLAAVDPSAADDDTQPAKKIKVDEDGVEMEWDDVQKGWFPKVDTTFLASYNLSYGMEKREACEVGNGCSNRGAPSNHIDPVTKKEYRWDEKSYVWINVDDEADRMLPGSTDSTGGQPTTYTDPQTGHQYAWDQQSNQWVAAEYTDPNTGSVYRWDSNKRQYLPPGGAEEDEEEDEEDSDKPSEEAQKQPTKKKDQTPQWFEVEDEKNPNIYISGLPLDVTLKEVEELVSKYGIIMADPDSGKPKIKLYTNPDGTVKGDARCCYLKVESVNLALQLLDGMPYRGGHQIKAQRAKFQLKGDHFRPELKKKKKKTKKKNKNNQMKLLDWRLETESDRSATRKRCEKTVVLKNVFDSTTVRKNISMVEELEVKLKEVCGRFGEVKKVDICEFHPEGVVCVIFKDWEESDLCVSQLHQRQLIGQRTVTAQLWDGTTNYKVKETEEQAAERMEQWERQLGGVGSESCTGDSSEGMPSGGGGDLATGGETFGPSSMGLASGGETFGRSVPRPSVPPSNSSSSQDKSSELESNS